MTLPAAADIALEFIGAHKPPQLINKYLQISKKISKETNTVRFSLSEMLCSESFFSSAKTSWAIFVLALLFQEDPDYIHVDVPFPHAPKSFTPHI
jgi:hypothetical protein